MTRIKLVAALLGSSVLTSTAAITETPSCGTLIGGAIQEGCAQQNAGLTVAKPAGPSTERETGPVVSGAGFSISLDGDAIVSDPQLEDRVRKTDIALKDANVQVRFDGFEPRTRLAVEMVEPRAYGPGDSVLLQSELNYPAFVARGEMRIIDRAAEIGPRVVAVVPVEPGGRVAVDLPEGKNLVVVHRVYDARGRFDETQPLPLFVPDDRGLRADVEEGADTAATRGIRVRGGAVTVSATEIAPGATLTALGETVRADSNGRLVIERILPPGDYDIAVNVNGGGRRVAETRGIEIPESEWFYAVVGDLTLSFNEELGERDTDLTGRLQAYVAGERADGLEVTASIDTGEEELGDILRRLDEKDPRSVLERLDPSDGYATFGDDSSIRDDTPTSGRIYLELRREGNFFVWGDFQSGIEGSTFVRNERTHYGAHGYIESAETTAGGAPKTSLELFAAQPDQLVGRESFRGTGGTVYFLRRQDIAAGTEVLTVEVRDADSGRVTDQVRLVPGRDYEINYISGVITLNAPLTGATNNNLIQTNPGGDENVNLVAQYEFTPTTSDVDGFTLGGRLETWATDQLRFGATVQRDTTGSADQTAAALDLRYEMGANSHVQLDIAHSDGPGYDTDTSLDGGLTIDGTPAQDGTGTAVRLAGQADLVDLGWNREGALAAYIERREEGFSTLDYQVTNATGDETLFGTELAVKAEEDRLGYRFYADFYDNDAGQDNSEIGLEISGNISERTAVTVATEYTDRNDAEGDGSRLDLAARISYEAQPDLTYSAFVQTDVARDGLDQFTRLGVGVETDLSDIWAVGAEISGGTGGFGTRVTATRTEGPQSSYFGYELDPGRALSAGVPQSSNGGRYVLGTRNQVSEDTTIFAENTYDIFGDDNTRTLTSSYGVEYQRNAALIYDVALEFGEVDTDGAGAFDRRAVSLGVRYEDAYWRSRTRLEFRQDEVTGLTGYSDLDAIYFTTDARYKIDETRRLVFNLDAAHVDSASGTAVSGTYVEGVIGYAYRPIENERLNVLAQYRFLDDNVGQTIDGVSGSGPVQESHIFSLEANYDIDRNWTLGGKFGGRFTQSAASADLPYVDNDATLAAINARYHIVHEWDALVELRHLDLSDAGSSETGAMAAIYKHFGNNVKAGVGYNFGRFSDDLSDLTFDDQGVFFNIVAKF